MRLAVPLLLALLASCGEDSPPLPAGSLRLHRDGLLRVGQVETPDAARILRARAAQGPVSVEIDPDVSIGGAARLLDAAAEAGIASLDFVTSSERLTVRLGPRPAPPASLPPMPRPSPPEVTQAAGDVQLVARPAGSELLVRILRPPSPGQAARTKEAVAEISREIRTAQVVLAVEAPRSTPWKEVLAVTLAAQEALGDRVVRHEFVAAP